MYKYIIRNKKFVSSIVVHRYKICIFILVYYKIDKCLGIEYLVCKTIMFEQPTVFNRANLKNLCYLFVNTFSLVVKKR